jgi:LuxR family maltose regulon positive regulatory protein
MGDPQIARVLESFDSTTDDQLRISRGTAVVVALKRRGDYAEAADFGGRLASTAELTWTPDHRDGLGAATGAAALLHAGAASLMACRPDAAVRQFSAAFRKHSPLSNHAFEAAGKLSVIYALQGESHLAQTWLQHAERAAQRADEAWRFGPQERLGMEAARMLLAVDRMDWADFHRHSRAADRHVPTEMWAFILYARARAALFLGNQRHTIHQLHGYRQEFPDLFTRAGLPRVLLDTAEAELWMSLADLDRTEPLISQFGDHPLENVTAARFHLMTRQPKLAEARTDSALWPANISRRDQLTLALLAASAHLRLQPHSDQRVELLRQAAWATTGEVAPWLFTFAVTEREVLHLLGEHFPEVEPILAALDDLAVRYPFARSETVKLTQRERTLLTLLVADRPFDEIAAELRVSTATIRNHRKSLYRKLGATSRAHAIEIAQRTGLLNTP